MLLEQGKIVEFDRYERSTDHYVFITSFVDSIRPAVLLTNPASKFLALCKATGKEEFAVLKKMAGV
jgi:hypothetical protein